jgi:hypothetical protein
MEAEEEEKNIPNTGHMIKHNSDSSFQHRLFNSRILVLGGFGGDGTISRISRTITNNVCGPRPKPEPGFSGCNNKTATKQKQNQ